MTTVRRRARPRPAVRLRAVPPLDPPFDDESPTAAWSTGVGGQLALDLSGRGRPVGAPASRPRHPIAPPTRSDPTGPGGAEGPVRPGGDGPPPPGAFATATPEARQAARRFLTTCLEIFNGYRPVSHIRPVSGPAEAVTIVAQLAAALDRLVGPPPRPRHVRPVRPRLLRVCEPCPGVAEAAAVIDTAGRSWAMPFRLERRRGRWTVTWIRLL